MPNVKEVGELEIVPDATGPVFGRGFEAPSGDKTVYAWTRFPLERDLTTGFITKWLNEGEVVTKAKLGLNDDQWDEVLNSGSVREQKYPVPEGAPESPVEFRKKELAALAEQSDEG